MNADDLAVLKGRTPFTPFRVVMGSGESFYVPSPDWVWVHPFDDTKSIAYIAMPDGGTVRLDLRHAERIETLESGAA